MPGKDNIHISQSALFVNDLQQINNNLKYFAVFTKLCKTRAVHLRFPHRINLRFAQSENDKTMKQIFQFLAFLDGWFVGQHFLTPSGFKKWFHPFHHSYDLLTPCTSLPLSFSLMFWGQFVALFRKNLLQLREKKLFLSFAILFAFAVPFLASYAIDSLEQTSRNYILKSSDIDDEYPLTLSHDFELYYAPMSQNNSKIMSTFEKDNTMGRVVGFDTPESMAEEYINSQDLKYTFSYSYQLA